MYDLHPIIVLSDESKLIDAILTPDCLSIRTYHCNHVFIFSKIYRALFSSTSSMFSWYPLLVIVVGVDDLKGVNNASRADYDPTNVVGRARVLEEAATSSTIQTGIRAITSLYSPAFNKYFSEQPCLRLGVLAMYNEEPSIITHAKEVGKKSSDSLIS